MPARLNVVIVQSPRMSSLQSDVTEQVMIELLGRPGIDLLLIDSLFSKDSSTDHMALTALENDLVVVDWQAEDSILSQLASLEIFGFSAGHELNPTASSNHRSSESTRRIYCFDLRLGFKANQVASAILKLLASKQVRTVSIGNLAVAPLRPSAISNVGAPPQKQPLPEKPQLALGTRSVSDAQPVTGQSQATTEVTDREDEQLDRLVDGLNDSDW